MQAARRRPDQAAERGAVAVEFALLLPVLMLFLFGIIQYGYGLYQYQAFASALNDAGRASATGVGGCSQLGGVVAGLVSANGLPVDADHHVDVDVRWLDSTGTTVTGTPQRLNYAELRGTYENPLNLNIPLVPFPDRFTVSERVLQQGVIPGVTDDLSACPPTTGVPGP